MATILIVDDRPANRQFLVTLLGYSGHTLLEAENGAEALEIARAEHIDLIITDILMPVMDGYQLARELRDDGDLYSTPLIFYTATYQAREARSLAKAAGVQYVLTKPAEPQAILDLVDTALGRVPSPAPALDIVTKPLLNPLQVVSQKLAAKMQELGGISSKLSSLIELGIEIGGERDPQRLLEKFCESARQILNARYAAVGILSTDGRSLKHFITTGMDPETVARLGPPPTGKGILGLLLIDHEALRLRDLTSDPRAAGFPLEHPVMRSFLGVAIATSLQVYGRLYLTEKIGAEEFSEDDERVAITLAAQVAVAYENAQLYYDIQLHAVELQLEISERMKVEEALQAKNEEVKIMSQQLWQAAKLATMGELAASIAHELNNPLSTVSLRTELLFGQVPPDSEQVRSLHIIESEVKRMSSLVANLLQYGRRTFRQVSTCDVREEIANTMELIHYHLRQHNILTAQEFSPETPLVLADRQQLRQVFLNLFTNAADAMLHGGTLTVRTGPGEKPASGMTAPLRRSTTASLGLPVSGLPQVFIDVSDTGEGIAPENLDRVWEPFYTTKPEGKGTGLGLAICRRIIQEHGGTIEIISEGVPGKGTTVRITLPAAEGG